DTTERLLAGYGDRIRVVVHPQNMGYGTACNNGAAVASGDYLVFLNNDTIPLAGWLDALLHYAGEQKGAGAVGSKLIFPNGTIHHCGMVLDQERQPRHIYEGFPEDHPAVNRSRRFQMVTAASILIPRSVFDQLAGF